MASTNSKPRDVDRSDAESIAFGQKIRSLRRAANMTLQDLASVVGVSQSLISQVERGRASPSITSLRRIAAALDVPVAALFLDGAPRSNGETDRAGRRLVVRRDERKSLRVPPSRVAYELLTPDLSRQIEFIWIEYEAGSVTHPEPMSHPGEENAICIEGSVVVTIDGEDFTLNEGDSISFDSGRPHHVVNRAEDRAVLISAITPPTF